MSVRSRNPVVHDNAPVLENIILSGASRSPSLLDSEVPLHVAHRAMSWERVVTGVEPSNRCCQRGPMARRAQAHAIGAPNP
jgi:hypothetical protein